MSVSLCDKCLSSEYQLPIDISLQGCATDSDLNAYQHIQAELMELKDGDIIYHYFFDDTVKYSFINAERVIKSIAQCACGTCLLNSLNTNNPHYGDGAYATANASIIPDRALNPISIIKAHGLSALLEKRILRAVIRINDVGSFRKFSKTGGVVRSQPPGGVQIKRGSLIGHRIEEAEVIRFEKWSGSRWEYFGGYL